VSAWNRTVWLAAGALACACARQPDPDRPQRPPPAPRADDSPTTATTTTPTPTPAEAHRKVRFTGQDRSNTSPDQTDLLSLAFLTDAGQTVRLADYRGKKHVVLVFTRGFAGTVCPYCSAYTSRFIANYEAFRKRDAVLLVVFPGPADKIDLFIRSSTVGSGSTGVPFPILQDVDLKAAKALRIADNLVKPSTYIIDKQGKIRYAYVGTSTADRPPIAVLLAKLDEIP